jgi:hypothetical protein
VLRTEMSPAAHKPLVGSSNLPFAIREIGKGILEWTYWN